MLPLSSAGPHPAVSRGIPPAPVARGAFRPVNVSTQSARQTRALLAWGVLAGVAGIGIALGHVWLRLQVVEVGYRLSSTRQVVARLESERQDLLLAAARLEAPARLERLARERLGMVPPARDQELVLP